MDDSSAGTSDKQYVKILGTEGETAEHECRENFDVINKVVSCDFQDSTDIGDYICVSLRTGGSNGIDLTKVSEEMYDIAA